MSTDLIDGSSQIHKTAEIGNNVRIGPWCSIGKNVRIGDDSILESHIVIRSNTNLVEIIEFFSLALWRRSG